MSQFEDNLIFINDYLTNEIICTQINMQVDSCLCASVPDIDIQTLR